MDNLSLIKSTYEGANSQENARNTAAALADNARWTEAAGFPYAGTYVGFDAIVENVFKRLATEWEDFQFRSSTTSHRATRYLPMAITAASTKPPAAR